jgi:hypothetical protein
VCSHNLMGGSKFPVNVTMAAQREGQRRRDRQRLQCKESATALAVAGASVLWH